MDPAELRRLAEAAETPGPWAVDDEWGFAVRTHGTAMAVPSTGEPVCDTACGTDAAFIAAANPAAIISLLDRLEAVEAERDALRGALAALDDALGGDEPEILAAVDAARALLTRGEPWPVTMTEREQG